MGTAVQHVQVQYFSLVYVCQRSSLMFVSFEYAPGLLYEKDIRYLCVYMTPTPFHLYFLKVHTPYSGRPPPISLKKPKPGKIASNLKKSAQQSSAASLQMGLPQRAAPSNAGQMGLPLPPPDPSDPSLLVGSSFGFSMSGSESRYSVMSGSTGSSAYSTPM